ncbi:hypothetical protein TBLA_0B08400 [Henningerozyma blattae CBS 6284]|uniref:Uncharacterized protein n=1 Tax=Henningerozyma blattae (strain ATCC 34711 / CBS 6284 / DSM 70876 / NBRC 10599 / NRRL Y-10934 / UCD 77-7) TaxID=1071380 RepID=I2GZV3_HENB6|nr:hypothetical protein TBLA_0B08400 [Tetrapisispora blattae CBS 6284]CCH59655.1 hypothetical protein TBLA_0B08400 [Tetrapisispora blattae CBS 6284]
MHIETRYLEINFPDSILSLKRMPAAVRVLSTIYFTLSIILIGSTFMVQKQLQEIEGQGNKTDVGITFPYFQLSIHNLSAMPFALVLSTLSDIKIWKFLLTGLNLIIGGSFIESNWNSSKEMFKFVFGLGILINIIMVILSFILSVIFGNERFNSYSDGNHVILVGFTIIYKQLLPETTIFNLKNVSIFSKNFRFKLLPIFLLCILTLIESLMKDCTELISVWITFFVCWTYLRFFQKLDLSETNLRQEGHSNPDEDIIMGDASDTFQLIYFFPDPLKPLLSPIFNFTYYLCCRKMKIIRPFETDDIEKGNSVAGKRGAKPTNVSSGSQTEDRRRQLALEVLQERMV